MDWFTGKFRQPYRLPMKSKSYSMFNQFSTNQQSNVSWEVKCPVSMFNMFNQSIFLGEILQRSPSFGFVFLQEEVKAAQALGLKLGILASKKSQKPNEEHPKTW